MKSKEQPAKSTPVQWATQKWFSAPEQSWYANISSGRDVITYDDGKKLHGKWPWKTCFHDNDGTWSTGGETEYLIKYRWSTSNNLWHSSFCLLPQDPTSLSDPADVPSSMSDECLRKCLDQINLNTNDAVLLYSGVIQAVPLLGSVMRLNRILKDVSKHVSKSLRKKPFTTVIKDLIQADFIDRFVISPTLADARKFQDATDYTLRVIETARQRNSHAFALNATDKVVFSESETTGTYGGGTGSDAIYAYRQTLRSQCTFETFMLLEAEYDMTAVDPLKVWAQRVGLTRPLDSVWDLVPFSFVADYFTRAGDFISALSDEMSSVDGLNGRITNIIDIWETSSSQVECRRIPGAMIRGPSLNSGFELQYLVHSSSPAESKRERYRRTRVSNQFGRVFSALSRKEDYLSVNLDLSQTRKRTLAELIISAKL
jgi:hypothetical protein